MAITKKFNIEVSEGVFNMFNDYKRVIIESAKNIGDNTEIDNDKLISSMISALLDEYHIEESE